ncbi:MAG: hypothetical protein K0S99_1990 [Thermomicrobiales bacterium]|nr:hypothetical protein [Thermomicrobiales bacterium]
MPSVASENRVAVPHLALTPIPESDRVAAHLPRPLASLVGREQEIAALGRLLLRGDAALITLTGPGGVGKTRLALQVAADAGTNFPHGIRFVDLAPLADPTLVAPAVAHALGLREAGSAPLLDRLKAFLGDKQVLLILDNFEPVIDAAPFIVDLLEACPGLCVLATSRVRLRLSGEHEHVVPPLAVDEMRPGNGEPRSAAMQLFVDRAQAIQEDFVLSPENAVVVDAICRRLDGLPLAIELAAARLKVLPLPALLSRLERRLPVLTGGARNLPARQQTMRDAIAWSFDLLDASEQALFRRLAVFVGTFTMEAAEAVLSVPGRRLDVFEGIASLVDKSLLHPSEGTDGDPRFGMLETIREFALELLEHSGDARDVSRRHAAFYLALAEQMAPESLPGAPPPGLHRLTADRHNLWAAFDWLSAAHAAEECLRLAVVCGPWHAQGHIPQGWEWFSDALALAGPEPTATKGRALVWAAEFAIAVGAFADASALGQEAVSLWRALGDPRGQAAALHVLAEAEGMQEHPDAAVGLFEEELTIRRGLGEPLGLSIVLLTLAGALYDQGDRTRTIALAEEARTLVRQTGNRRWTGLTDWFWGKLAADERQYLEAARRFGDGLRALCEVDEFVCRFKPMVGLAATATDVECPEPAAKLLGAVDELLLRRGVKLYPWERPIYARAESMARSLLGEERFASAFRAGRDLNLTDLVSEAETVILAAEAVERSRHSVRNGVTSHGLTRRELEVLRLVAAGHSNREIADALFIGVATVKSHLNAVLGKLGLSSRSAAAAYAHMHDLA